MLADAIEIWTDAKLRDSVRHVALSRPVPEGETVREYPRRYKMSEDNKFQVLVGKVLTDPLFAAWLSRDPERALQSIGIEPTEEMLEAIAEHRQSLNNLSAAFGGSGDWH